MSPQKLLSSRYFIGILFFFLLVFLLVNCAKEECAIDHQFSELLGMDGCYISNKFGKYVYYYLSGDSTFLDLDADGQDDICFVGYHWTSLGGTTREELKMHLVNDRVEVAGQPTIDTILICHRGMNGDGPCEFKALQQHYQPNSNDVIVAREPSESFYVQRIDPAGDLELDDLDFYKVPSGTLYRADSRYTNNYFCGMRSLLYGDWMPDESFAYLGFKINREVDVLSFLKLRYRDHSLFIEKSYYRKM